MVSENPQKVLLTITKNIKLSALEVSEALTIHPTSFIEATIQYSVFF